MKPVNFPEAEHSLGRPSDMKDDECGPLPVAHGLIDVGENGSFPVVISAWQLTPEELEALNKGGHLYLHVLGKTMAPVILSTRIEAHTLAGKS